MGSFENRFEQANSAEDPVALLKDLPDDQRIEGLCDGSLFGFGEVAVGVSGDVFWVDHSIVFLTYDPMPEPHPASGRCWIMAPLFMALRSKAGSCAQTYGSKEMAL